MVREGSQLRKLITILFLALLGAIPAFGQSSVYQQNQFLAGPISGSGFPAPRKIVASDIAGIGGSGQNCSLSAVAGGNAVQFSLLDAGGNTPTTASPCVLTFRNATQNIGSTVTRVVTSATTLTLNPGSTLGTQNNVPFKVWVSAIDNGSTAVLAVSQQFNPSAIAPLPIYNIISSTACSSCGTATSFGVFYSTVGQTNRPWTPLGFAEWGSGLVTAGTWATGPTLVQNWGPGIALPGQPTGGSSSGSTSAQTTNTGTSYAPVTGCATSLSMSLASNYVSLTWKTEIIVTSSGDQGAAALIRSGTIIGKPTIAPGEAAFAFTTGTQTWNDAPGNTSSNTWTVNVKQVAGTGGIIAPNSNGGCSVVAQEMQS